MYSIDEILNDDLDNVDNVSHINEENDNLENPENEGNEDEVQKEENEDEDKNKKKTKRTVHRVVLNAERLKGPRGLICMEREFSKLKFKGRGYEQQDLDTAMNALQHWCHRLYPKYTFDDSLDQIEKLGLKKTVGTMRKKIIMNMIDEEIFGTTKLDDNDVDEPVDRVSSPEVDQFDLLLGDTRPPQRERSPEMELTEEQIEIMERNRMLASERRRARLEAQDSRDTEVGVSSLQITQDDREFGVSSTQITQNDTEVGVSSSQITPDDTEVDVSSAQVSQNDTEVDVSSAEITQNDTEVGVSSAQVTQDGAEAMME